jgi:hypothetical protein
MISVHVPSACPLWHSYQSYFKSMNSKAEMECMQTLDCLPSHLRSKVDSSEDSGQTMASILNELRGMSIDITRATQVELTDVKQCNCVTGKVSVREPYLQLTKGDRSVIEGLNTYYNNKEVIAEFPCPCKQVKLRRFITSLPDHLIICLTQELDARHMALDHDIFFVRSEAMDGVHAWLPSEQSTSASDRQHFRLIAIIDVLQDDHWWRCDDTEITKLSSDEQAFDTYKEGQDLRSHTLLYKNVTNEHTPSV